MKYHKIRGIDKAICTAEQMVAYNIAFRLHINVGDRFKEICTTGTGINIAEAIDDIMLMSVKNYHNSYEYAKMAKKYDEDAIFSALRNGIKDYLLKPFIATDYAKIGKAFKALYLD